MLLDQACQTLQTRRAQLYLTFHQGRQMVLNSLRETGLTLSKNSTLNFFNGLTCYAPRQQSVHVRLDFVG